MDFLTSTPRCQPAVTPEVVGISQLLHLGMHKIEFPLKLSENSIWFLDLGSGDAG